MENLDPVSYIESKFGITLKSKGNGEYCGPCPWCQGEDRFIIWDEGNYMCRPGDGHCGRKGWVDNIDGHRKYTKEEQAILRLHSEQKRAERERHELKKRVTALEKMAKCTDHLTYHKMLDTDDIAWWVSQGITEALIEEYKLGICYQCPTDAQRRPSYTIPVFDSAWSKLLNIKHRLIGETKDKYRPHMAGLGLQLFNSRWVKSGTSELCIVEGSKKSIVVSDKAIPACGIFGANGFNFAWLKHFTDIQSLYIMLDHDKHEQCIALAKEIGKRSQIPNVYACRPTVKPDDFFLFGGTKDKFMSLLTYARPLKKNGEMKQ